MCTTCGCGEGEVSIEGQPHHHHCGHEHRNEHVASSDSKPVRSHAPGMSQARMIKMEHDILAANNVYAAANRTRFERQGIFAVNLVSSPGSGKTTLLTQTIHALRRLVKIAVIEGDQQTSQDAERIRDTGVRAVQINTGKGCHLDAHMVGHAMERLALADDSLLFIENVGNLVCPAAFDLGEAHKVAILSVTEGTDKPLKYPEMFHEADLLLINKIDLLPYVDFDLHRCVEYARRVNPEILVFSLSATRCDGMMGWLAWLQQRLQATVVGKAARRERQTSRNAESDPDSGKSRTGVADHSLRGSKHVSGDSSQDR